VYLGCTEGVLTAKVQWVIKKVQWVMKYETRSTRLTVISRFIVRTSVTMMWHDVAWVMGVGAV
jgi:hypothetical protein